MSTYEDFCNQNIEFKHTDNQTSETETCVIPNIIEYLDFVSSLTGAEFKDITNEVKTLCNLGLNINKVFSKTFANNSHVIKLGNCSVTERKYLKVFEPLFVLYIYYKDNNKYFEKIVATRSPSLLVKYITKHIILKSK